MDNGLIVAVIAGALIALYLLARGGGGGTGGSGGPARNPNEREK